MRSILASLTVFAVLLGSVAPARAQQSANPEREFIMSCTYGVLAGTLVGAASLAFVDKPGDNLQRVARGASLGLYMGIGLGIYTVYILPGQIEREEQERLDPDRAIDYQSRRNFQIFPFVADAGDASLASGLGFALRF